MSVHPPKVEVFDPGERTNTDPKGFLRPVDEYRVEPWGLYMARPSDHPTFDYLESWLLPSMGLRVSIFHYLPAHRRDQDYYIDIGEFTERAGVWHSVDHYLDLVVRTGKDVELLDVDELLDARVAGLLDGAAAETAVLHAVAAVDGLARHGYDPVAWLGAREMTLTWRD